eukprot:NODE_1531_length_583_cov_377.460674_g1230_i0.p1 GENE.NODE_1531_length_583_cov_377.460674_g1230_i0~~NODE_1531_length_583_cov_377.460674_g1230_i0.p1  ORF type:complete len:146 (+),score=28.95 NODE_1531_length_583_cov_377.460674_g1230_i0:29-466(+)
MGSIRQLGNTEFKEKNTERALDKYSKALRYLEIGDDGTQEQKDKAKAEKISCYSNRAQCGLNLGKWMAAKQDCDALLALDPDNKKGYFRRGKANINLSEFESAADDLAKSDQTDSAVIKAMAELQQKSQAAEARQRQAFGKMFKD